MIASTRLSNSMMSSIPGGTTEMIIHNISGLGVPPQITYVNAKSMVVVSMQTKNVTAIQDLELHFLTAVNITKSIFIISYVIHIAYNQMNFRIHTSKRIFANYSTKLWTNNWVWSTYPGQIRMHRESD